MDKPDTVEVKICGLTSSDDAAAALALGADYLGFVLYAGSPRGITAAKLQRILARLAPERKVVGVFVNEERGAVERIARDCGLFAVQFHGDEPASGFADMPVPVWRAVRVGNGKPAPDPAVWPAARYVVDAAVPGVHGGSGRTADWMAAGRLASGHAVMLAGGLTPDNVAEAVRIVRPAGVDVASGVEASPGAKDYRKMAAFVKRAREALKQAPV